MSTQSRIRFHNMKICRTRECAKNSGNGKAKGPLRTLGSVGNLIAVTLVCALFQTALADDDKLKGTDAEAEELAKELTEQFEAAGILGTDKEVTKDHLNYEGTVGDEHYKLEFEGLDIFKDEKTWEDAKAILKTEDETTHGIITDDKITTEEFTEITALHYNWEWWVWALVIGLPILGLVVGVVWYKCYRNTEENAVARNTVGEGTIRRRMVYNPVASLSQEIGAKAVPYATLNPTSDADVTVTQYSAVDVSPSSHWTPGLDEYGICWILPLSCVFQIFWIYAIYKTYKACKALSSKDQPHEELREITVRR